ncbi:uncharacterized protein TRAVEDRAFT_167749 [Trametes versicolor FP-101664 SS1]|uniref:uncharacterized protein n=1 Tax=Trametes versicolor (strain FP-101664) TaxID=717944 RepID=UPI0004621DDC|nr:uncharacterized protein TRAVEDRAFT_167749 [Trametes versicolor FP-101664 SS1]EIW58285.1 hypothetical protein TRAVEDRAFT_167749 [Trametes versicolor FP-101664 SS1]
MSAVTSPELSPVLGPNARARRLSARRGSVAAADPWGEHNDVNMNPARSLTSRLTIVRVPQTDIEEPPRRHRRHGSNASLNSNASGKSDGPGGRLSFAFTSFSPTGPSGSPSGRPASPSGSPRLRPSSPSTSRFSSTFPSHSKLSPEQIVDIARNSVNPRSPLPSPNGPNVQQVAPSPVSFTPLPDSIYLPFIDRPEEVTALIQALPNARLFALLQQTFPPDARAPMGSEYDPSTASPDPKDWTFADLEFWLKKVDRDVAEDVNWIRKTRRCVMSHSELIWERVKGALGVPPELDVEEEGLELPQTEPLTSAALDSAVFEPDSPIVAHETFADSVGEEIMIEPVFANQTPPLGATEPAGGLGSSLSDLREEDENEGNEGKGGEEPEVHGIRFITSPSAPSALGDQPLSMSPMVGLGSPAVRQPIGMPGSQSSGEFAYDVLRERGPGHPLFPSNFAQLSIGPTLQPSKRTMSMSYPPRPAYLSPHSIRGGVHRTNSIDIGAGRAARMARPEWARSWDPTKHEYAVTTASTGSVSGAE